MITKKRLKRKAQAAIEYILIIVFILGFSAPLVYIFATESVSLADQAATEQAYTIGREIVENAENVYYLGEPSKVRLKMVMPAGIESAQLINKALIFRVRSSTGGSDIVIPTAINISGNLPITQGQHHLSIESKDGHVYINET